MRRRSKVTIRIPQSVERGWIECPVWGCFDWAYPNSEFRRGAGSGLWNGVAFGDEQLVSGLCGHCR